MDSNCNCNCNSNCNKFLIIVIGDNDSKHYSYSKIPQNVFFDLFFISMNNNSSDTIKKYATFYYTKKNHKKKSKWDLVSFAISKLIEKNVFKQYQYIWIPDDSLHVDSEKIKMLFLHSLHLKINLGQPALIPVGVKKSKIIKNYKNNTRKFNKYIEANSLPQHTTPHIRIVSSIEKTCPIFSYDFLLHLYTNKLLHLSVLSWMQILNTPSFKMKKIIIFDYIAVQQSQQIACSKCINYKTINSINVMKRQEFNFPKINIGFIHTPKTGGTAVKTLMAKYSSDNHVEKVFLRVNQKTIWMIMYWHTSAVMMKKQYNLSFIIGVIRNPYERFTSAFYYNKERGKNHPRQDLIKEIIQVHDILQPINTIHDLLLNTTLMKKLMTFNHFKPLTYWFMKDQTCIADYILEQNTLQSDFDPVLQLLNIQNKIEKVNVTSKKKSMTCDEKTLFEQYYKQDIILYDKLCNTKETINTRGLVKLKTLLNTSAY